jgi:hypothetical protein
VHSWGCSSQNFTSKTKLLKPEQARYRNNALNKFSKETVELIQIYQYVCGTKNLKIPLEVLIKNSRGKICIMFVLLLTLLSTVPLKLACALKMSKCTDGKNGQQQQFQAAE